MNGKPVADPRSARTAVVVLVVLSLLGVGALGGVGIGTADTTVADPGGSEVQQAAACDFRPIYDRTVQSVVTVRVFDPGGERGLGSGWVDARNGSDALIVTNAHVIEGAAGADVRFSDGQWRPVQELVGIDPYADLAVLRVHDVPPSADALTVSGSLPDQGDEVAALGSPLGLEGTITKGIVSSVDRSVTVGAGGETYTVVDAIQIDTPISPGNSGGPLVNCDGEVVGVNFAGVSPLVGQDINFALSAAMVRKIVPVLVKNGTYNHSYMGVRAQTLSPTVARINGIDESTQGVLVDTVVADGPADGVLQGSTATERVTGSPVGGDVIVAVNGTSVGDVDDLREYLFENTRPGDTVTLSILRDGKRTTVDLTVAPRPLPRERSPWQEPSV